MTGWDGDRARSALLWRFDLLVSASEHIGFSDALLRRCLENVNGEQMRGCYAEWIALAADVSMDFLFHRTENPQRAPGARRYSDFWGRVLRLQDEKGYSFVRFCSVTGLDAARMRSLQYLQGTPSIGVLCRVADAFGVSLDWLMGNTDERRILK